MYHRRPQKTSARSVPILLGLALLIGCGTPPAPPASQVDDAPLREAVRQYLVANNMGMEIKEIKVAPAFQGETATMTASMTREQVAGPSVTWEFHFAKQPNGSWKVTHYDKR